MTIDEAVNMRYGDMIDLINCMSVYNGSAEIKEEKKSYSFDDAMALR